MGATTTETVRTGVTDMEPSGMTASAGLPAMTTLMDELSVVWRDIRSDAQGGPSSSSKPGWFGSGLIMVGLVFAGIEKLWGVSSWLTYASLALLVFSICYLIYFVLTDGRIALRELRNLDQDIFTGIGINMEKRYSLCLDLRQRYSEDQIRFAQAYLLESLAQARPRLSSLVGPLEKIGIVPLVASAIVTFATTLSDKDFSFYWYSGVAIATFMYFMAFRFFETTHAIQRASMLLHAVQAGREQPAPEMMYAGTGRPVSRGNVNT